MLIERHFDSLQELLEFLKPYEDQKLNIKGKSIEDLSSPTEQLAPAYLFRGEPGLFPQTQSSEERLVCLAEEGKLGLERNAVNLLRSVSAQAQTGMLDQLGMSALTAVGFAQHYGLPTEFVDFTQSLDVAAHFAVANQGLGVIMLLNTQRTSEISTIAELCYDHFSLRARRQQAWIVTIQRDPRFDLKADRYQEKAVGAKGLLRIFTFDQSTESYKQHYRESLLEVWDDPLAPWITMCINSFCKSHGPLSEVVADWLVQRVAPIDYLIMHSENNLNVEDGKPVDATGNLVAPQESSLFGMRGGEDIKRIMLKESWTSAGLPTEVPPPNSVEHNMLYRRATTLIKHHIFPNEDEDFLTDSQEDYDLDEGVRLLNRVLELEPSNWAALFFKGKAHQTIGQREQAYRAFKDAYLLQDSHVDILRELCCECLALSHLDEAVKYARLAVTAEPNDAGLHSNLALALLLLGDTSASAEAAYALQLAPDDLICQNVLRIVTDIESGRIPRPNRLL